ncbi:tetratricopeptide repeat family protein [Sesbania bispinosa]|nr:tetratricopeptide repeat family protein [Sesbania bispinosa]
MAERSFPEGENLSQEVDAIKAIMKAMNGQMEEVKRMLVELLNKSKENDGINQPGAFVWETLT